MRPLILDTTVLIAALRNPSEMRDLRRLAVTSRPYLTAVTVAELQAGARNRTQAAAVHQLTTVFTRFDRLLTPTAAEWEAAGRLIAQARWHQGAMAPRDHYADVLIVQIAARLKATLVTANQADFLAWIALGNLNVRLRNTHDTSSPER